MCRLVGSQQSCRDREIVDHIPPYDSITFAHISQVVNQLPHGWVRYAHFIDIHSQERKPSASQQVRHISGVCVQLAKHHLRYIKSVSPVIGEICGEMPPSRSISANCSDVLVRQFTSESRIFWLSHLSSNNVSPPKRAPRNTPSGCRASLI